ncbi:MAG TPA: hypothetical protein VFF85_04570 [Microbacterium sp.]|nr:hypothetical protein [Microbacterium sp.]
MPLLLSDHAATTAPVPLVTTAEARMLGISLAPQRWHRVRRGVYAERAAYKVLKPWSRYAARVHAFVRTHPDAVLCLESAAVIHGLPLFNETRDIHVLGDAGDKPRRFGDVWVHTSEDPRTVERVDGVHVTSLLDTAVDLTRVMSPAKALAVADSAVSTAQGGSLEILDALDLLDAQSNRRGVNRARWAWSRANGLSESPSESVSRAVIEWSGFEAPDLQKVFRYEGHEDRADFHFPSCRAIGEADGWQKYALGDPAKAAAKLADEKRREDRLRRNRHPFARWDLADAWKVDPLCASLHAAGVPLTRLAQPAMLGSLRHSPRELPRA